MPVRRWEQDLYIFFCVEYPSSEFFGAGPGLFVCLFGVKVVFLNLRRDELLWYKQIKVFCTFLVGESKV